MPDTPYETTEYKIEPHPPLVSQVCGRCGAQAQHDACERWSQMMREVAPTTGDDRG